MYNWVVRLHSVSQGMQSNADLKISAA